MQDSYLSQLQAATEGLLKDRGSRFLAFAFPVADQTAIEERLQELKKRFYDARHHCYAYRLGKDGQTTFATDDGEPAHSAGAPILGAIRSEGLTNILVVVVRYFGGIKLGVRGLIEAYRGAALEAIADTARIILIPKVNFEVHFGYEQTSDINRLFHPFNLTQEAAAYTDRCKVTFSIEKSEFESVKEVMERGLLDWRMISED